MDVTESGISMRVREAHFQKAAPQIIFIPFGIEYTPFILGGMKTKISLMMMGLVREVSIKGVDSPMDVTELGISMCEREVHS